MARPGIACFYAETGSGDVMAQRRDEEFQPFYRENLLPLRRLAFRLTGDRDEAEELAQDAMVRTYRAWRRLDPERRPDMYARTVMLNRHRSVLRRALVERRQPRERLLSEPDGGRAESIAVIAELMRLPVRQRQALVLHYFEDRPQTEVAQILGCPAGTVNSLVYRGLAALRGRLAPEEPEEESTRGAR